MEESKVNVQDDQLENSKAKKPIYLFGKDVREIVCFRDSFICGICCGFGGGLVSFLVTSKTLLSTHVAFASLWIGVFGYWIPCRYKYENNSLILEQFNLMRNPAKVEENQLQENRA